MDRFRTISGSMNCWKRVLLCETFGNCRNPSNEPYKSLVEWGLLFLFWVFPRSVFFKFRAGSDWMYHSSSPSKAIYLSTWLLQPQWYGGCSGWGVVVFRFLTYIRLSVSWFGFPVVLFLKMFVLDWIFHIPLPRSNPRTIVVTATTMQPQ